MAENLPRGITTHKWKNPISKTRSLRYRVRIKRKDPQSPTGYFIFDKSFETLDEAKEALASSKTRDGRLGLTERVKMADMATEIAKTMIRRPDLRSYMTDYINTYIKSKATGNAVKDRSAKVNQERLEHLLGVELLKLPDGATGFEVMLPGVKGATYKPLGNFKLTEITAATGTALIRERLKTCAPSTVHREISAMTTFWRKLKFIDPTAFAALRLNGNPFEEADKSLLKGWNKKRRRVLGEGTEEEALFNVLAARRKPEILQIVSLSLSTGMRRGETLLLRWDQVKDGFIQLETAFARLSSSMSSAGRRCRASKSPFRQATTWRKSPTALSTRVIWSRTSVAVRATSICNSPIKRSACVLASRLAGSMRMP